MDPNQYPKKFLSSNKLSGGSLERSNTRGIIYREISEESSNFESDSLKTTQSGRRSASKNESMS